jgi:hypothetical protein
MVPVNLMASIVQALGGDEQRHPPLAIVDEAEWDAVVILHTWE